MNDADKIKRRLINVYIKLHYFINLIPINDVKFYPNSIHLKTHRSSISLSIN